MLFDRARNPTTANGSPLMFCSCGGFFLSTVRNVSNLPALAMRDNRRPFLMPAQPALRHGLHLAAGQIVAAMRRHTFIEQQAHRAGTSNRINRLFMDTNGLSTDNHRL